MKLFAQQDEYRIPKGPLTPAIKKQIWENNSIGWMDITRDGKVSFNEMLVSMGEEFQSGEGLRRLTTWFKDMDVPRTG